MTLRILIIASDFKPMLGGIAQYTHGIAAQLHHLGCQVRVLTFPYKNNPSGWSDDQVPYEIVRCKKNFSRSRIQRYLGRIQSMRSYRPDVCILNNISGYPSTLLAAKLCGIPVLACIYGSEIRKCLLQGISGKAKLWALGRFDGLIADSQYIGAFTLTHCYGHPRVTVVYPGLYAPDPELMSSFKNPDLQIPPYFFSLGRHVRHKSFDKSILAFARIADEFPDCRYIIAGEGPDTARFKRIASLLGMDHRVKFVGKVDNDTRQRLMANCLAFVMPSRELPDGEVEGYGIVFQEAALVGRPSIGGASGGVPEAVLHEKTGLIAAPPTHRKIADCMRRLLSDPGLADRLGQQARQRVFDEMNMEVQTQKLYELLQDICNKDD